MVQAVEAYRHISATEKFMALERMREDMRHNEIAALNHARRQGKREGICEGEYNKAIKTAGILKGKGMPVNDIAEATGLTVDDVLRL